MYITNLPLLDDYIKKSGYRRDHIANFLGMSRASFIYRMTGKVDFTITDVNKLRILLNLSDADIIKIFFPTMLNDNHVLNNETANL